MPKKSQINEYSDTWFMVVKSTLLNMLKIEVCSMAHLMNHVWSFKSIVQCYLFESWVEWDHNDFKVGTDFIL